MSSDQMLLRFLKMIEFLMCMKISNKALSMLLIFKILAIYDAHDHSNFRNLSDLNTYTSLNEFLFKHSLNIIRRGTNSGNPKILYGFCLTFTFPVHICCGIVAYWRGLSSIQAPAKRHRLLNTSLLRLQWSNVFSLRTATPEKRTASESGIHSKGLSVLIYQISGSLGRGTQCKRKA